MIIQFLGSYQDSQSKPTLKTIKFDYREDDIDPLSFHIVDLLINVLNVVSNADSPGHGEFIDMYIDGEKMFEMRT